jgi:ABC-type sugar transport system substrate-binding protein
MATWDPEDQLEIQFDGDIVDVKAPGRWASVWEETEKNWDRARFLRLSAGLGLAAFGVGTASPRVAAAASRAARPGAGITVAACTSGFNQANQLNLTGTLHALRGTAYKVLLRSGDFDEQHQITAIEALLAQRIQGLDLQPVTVQSGSRAALTASRAGVKAITSQLHFVKTPADRVLLGATTLDNRYGSVLLARYLKRARPDGGKILVVEGFLGQGWSEGFTKYMDPVFKGTKWQIVAKQPADWVTAKAVTVFQNMLTAHPDAKIVISHSASMGLGVAQVLKKLRRKDILHVTMDGLGQMIPLMRDGYISAALFYSSADMGTVPMRMIRRFLESGKRPPRLVTPIPMVIATRSDLNARSGQWILNDTGALKPTSGVFGYRDLMPAVKRMTS